ncbi:MAG: DUF2188 domain-containing protein [Chloroflexi bacterium]|nr:DUF2188 domain-containing protein [Chloroflexota bacterium]
MAGKSGGSGGGNRGGSGAGRSGGGGASRSGSGGSRSSGGGKGPSPNKPIWVGHDQKSDQWRAKREDAERAIAVGDTKKEVVDRARQVARNTESELIITRKDDHTIQSRDSHGHDPNPPKDKD